MATVSTYDEELDLGLPGDVPLPFGDRVEELSPEAEVARLRAALAGCLSWAEGRTTPHAFRVREWRQLVNRPAVEDQAATPEERRDEGIARAAARWTDEETAAVDTAIRTVATRKASARVDAAGCQRVEPYTDAVIRIGEFTTADVWAELGTGFPVTKGIAGRMASAVSAGIIVSTGRTVIAPRDATGPNHGQRLTVWRAL